MAQFELVMPKLGESIEEATITKWFIKVGDTLIKRNGSNSIVIKRAELDTIINLKFENLKGAELYSEKNEFLNNQKNGLQHGV